jgi:hypothetical protein
MTATKFVLAVLLLATAGGLGAGLFFHGAPAQEPGAQPLARAARAPAPPPRGEQPARKESKAVNVEGIEFRAYVQPQCVAPPPGEWRPFDLGLRISNTTDKPLTFALMDRIVLDLETRRGKGQ